jgi:hypothetical protein
METAAAMEIENGGLRPFPFDDFHRCLEKPAGFSHSFHRPDGGQPTTNKTGQITCYQNRTFLLATDNRFSRPKVPR